MLSAFLILVLTCLHGPLSAAMPHDFLEAPHSDNHHSPGHQDDHAPMATRADAGDASSSHAPASAGHHQHQVADAVPNGSSGFATVRPSVAMRLPADDDLVVQDQLGNLLEPPIA